MKNKNKIVSIVIPVYNVEEYIEKCIISVLNQTYKNIEIIIVNDGSIDKSEEKIQKFVKEDKRIKYIIKENGGLSSARNKGIETATGDYICFIDSDDWVAGNYIECLLSRIEQDKSDISICNIKYVYQDNFEKIPGYHIDVNETINNKTALQYLFKGKKYQNHAVNKLYKLNLFKDNNIKFPESRIYEDAFTMYKLLYKAKKISLCNEYLYFYLKTREGSILNTKFNKKRLDLLDAMVEISKEDFIKKMNIQNEFQEFCLTNLCGLFYYIFPNYNLKTRKEWKNNIRKIQKHESRKISKGYIKNKQIGFFKKIQVFLIYNNPDLFCYIMKILKK